MNTVVNVRGPYKTAVSYEPKERLSVSKGFLYSRYNFSAHWIVDVLTFSRERLIFWSRDRAMGIVTGYGLDDTAD